MAANAVIRPSRKQDDICNNLAGNGTHSTNKSRHRATTPTTTTRRRSNQAAKAKVKWVRPTRSSKCRQTLLLTFLRLGQRRHPISTRVVVLEARVDDEYSRGFRMAVKWVALEEGVVRWARQDFFVHKRLLVRVHRMNSHNLKRALRLYSTVYL